MLALKSSLFLLLGTVILVNSAAIDDQELKPSDAEVSSFDDDGQLEAELLKTIRKGIMAEIILRDRLSKELDEESDATKEKRFSKWRSGDIRSRVKQLHQQNYLNDYNPMLRKIWENNMMEKNRLYQNLIG
ncbi:hypothetical protein BpHYR1_031127 [Brachionus plicatilis]|uniref:Uncharacterized protein n=1 Tax=Brachionus plicatilis TaxID=10195 RepID=A0A3M7SIY4_BRAPC|nr:hypothetical protein BpHYR1_031127 [Brachionus plicatilis]